MTDLPEPDSPTMPERLAALEIEADAVDRLDDAVFGLEVGLQVADRQQGAHDVRRVCGSSASRRPSPRKLSENSVSAIVTPGKISCQGKTAMF